MSITTSPTITNFVALRRLKAATNSGKYRVSGLPDLDSRSTRLPSRKARQRNPSHLGSYCHCRPTGRLVAGAASIGRYVLAKGNVNLVIGWNDKDGSCFQIFAP